MNRTVSTCNIELNSVSQQTSCYAKQILPCSVMLGEPLHSQDRSLVTCFNGWNRLFSEFTGATSYLVTANTNSVHVSFFPSPKKNLDGCRNDTSLIFRWTPAKTHAELAYILEAFEHPVSDASLDKQPHIQTGPTTALPKAASYYFHGQNSRVVFEPGFIILLSFLEFILWLYEM